MMYSDLYQDPYRSGKSAFDQWASGVLPGWEWLFRDPLAEARAFYGETVLQSIMEGQRRHLEQQRILAERLPEMVDDVAGQWIRG